MSLVNVCCCHRTLFTCLVIPWLAVAGAPSMAQDQQEPRSEIEEVVVTAQKRQQTLEDVGVAVAAFTSRDIEERGLGQPYDLAEETPNLNINNAFGNSIPNVSIRGLGLNDYAVNNNPATGIYVDEVYLVSPAMLSFQLFDLERVEVLKGPQGTLYGRNTNAGAVNFISKKPEGEIAGYVSAGYGDYDLLQAEAAIGGALDEQEVFGARVAVHTTQQMEGHQSNRDTGKDVGAVSRTAWRVLFSWQPTDRFDAMLNIHGGSDDSDTLLVKVDNAFTDTDDAFFPGDPFDSGGRSETFMELDSRGAALTVNLDISDNLTLTSVTGYEDFTRAHSEDRDGTALLFLDGTFMNEIEQISEELRLTWVGEGRLITAGVFYGSDEVSTRDNFIAPALVGFALVDFTVDPPDMTINPSGFYSLGNQYQQETDSLALFAHSEWDLATHWRLIAGARYTKDEKSFSDAYTFFTPAGPDPDGADPATAPRVQVSTDEIAVFPAVSHSADFSSVSGKLGVDYLGIENALIYASISKGFKSGGYQGQLTFNPADLAGYDQEDLLAYELGAKGRFRGNTLRLSGAIFLYDYTDFQLYGSHFQDPNVGPLFGILNVGDAEVFGAEVDVLFVPSAGLEFRLGVGILDSEVSTVTNSDFVTEGSTLPNAPEFSASASVSYDRPVGNNMNGSVFLGFSYKGETAYDIVRAPDEAIEDAYTLGKLRVGVSGDFWSAHLWVKNLLDEEYRSQVLTSSVGFGETWGLPRTWGGVVRFHF